MNNKSADKIMRGKVKWYTLAFLFILVLSVFLRIYKFDDWLFVKGDQVRDAKLVSHAYEGGPAELPLLGPRAGGTMLRLGPAFYYFQYISAEIFQRTDAPVFAYPNLLFSILSIPLFYLFLKKLFDSFWPMLLTAVYAFSFLAIEYSRFAWNPNSIPFFNLLYFYSLLEIFDRNQRNKIRWTAVAAAAFAVSTQLHFSSFLVLPVVTAVFLLYHFKSWKEYISVRSVLMFIGIVLIFYLPVILSDLILKGDNAKEFWEAIGTKSSSQTLVKKVSKDAYYFGQYYFRILTGYFGSKSDWFYAMWVFILSSLLLGGRLFWKEKDENKKKFIMLVIFWFLGYFAVYIPLANSIDNPRFFLPVLMIPAVFFGFWAKSLEKYQRPIIRYSVLPLIILSLGANLFWTLEWFRELRLSETGVNNPKAMILSAKGKPMWWNWWHFEKAAGYMVDQCPNDQIYYTLSKAGDDYSASLKLAMSQRDGSKSPAKYNKNKEIYSDACYYEITASNAKISKEANSNFEKEDPVIFGDLTIAKMSPLNGSTAYRAYEEAQSETATPSEDVMEGDELPGHQRMYWKDVFTKL